MSRGVSIKEVAQAAGVSVGTVSNVLNRPEKVADATVQRVQAAIRSLGFVRNDAARQLRGRPREPQPACHAGLSGGWRDAPERTVGHRPRRHERIAKQLERRGVVCRVHPRPAEPALRVRNIQPPV